MSKISVIVPVYKVEPFINRCVDSILSQTFSDFELILVDDGSPDNCPEICDDFRKADARVKVIHQKNGGVSAARNAGIEYALKSESQWLTFIDGDDWVHKRFLELLIASVENANVLIGMCRYLSIDKYCEDSVLSDVEVSIINPEKALVPGNDGLEAYAWGKIYRKELFNQTRFPLGMVMEDFWLIPEVLFMSEEIAFVPERLYYYYQNPQSIIHNPKWKTYKDAWLGFEKQIPLYVEHNADKLYHLQINTYICHLYSGLCWAQTHDQEHFHDNKKYIILLARKHYSKHKDELDYSDVAVCTSLNHLLSLPELYLDYKRNRMICNDNSSALLSFVKTMWNSAKRRYYSLISSMYTKSVRNKCKNDNFSIICSNCIGGFIYHRLGKQFLTPTINCFMNPKDFVKFCNNIPYYISMDLKFIQTEKTYPVGRLDDIYVWFNHSNTEEDAARDWNKRKQRINFDNLYIIAYDQYARDEERLTKEDILMLKDIPCNNLVVLSELDYPDISYVKTIPKFGKGLAELYFDQDKYGMMTFEKKFNYVQFLNKVK